jgi:hypothetical protein
MESDVASLVLLIILVMKKVMFHGEAGKSQATGVISESWDRLQVHILSII